MGVLHLLAVFMVFACGAHSQPGRLSQQRAQCCPDGWVVYKGSCFYFGRDKLNYEEAVQFCSEQADAKLAVISHTDEYLDFYRATGAYNSPSWVGLRVAEDKATAEWAMQGGMNPDELEWLVGAVPHGQTAAALCVAMFNPQLESIRAYNHFYPCTLPYNYICELNRTAQAYGSESLSRQADPVTLGGSSDTMNKVVETPLQRILSGTVGSTRSSTETKPKSDAEIATSIIDGVIKSENDRRNAPLRAIENIIGGTGVGSKQQPTAEGVLGSIFGGVDAIRNAPLNQASSIVNQIGTAVGN